MCPSAAIHLRRAIPKRATSPVPGEAANGRQKYFGQAGDSCHHPWDGRESRILAGAWRAGDVRHEVKAAARAISQDRGAVSHSAAMVFRVALWFLALVGTTLAGKGDLIWCGDRNCYDVLGCGCYFSTRLRVQ
jgi:hypothetical protein